ncbi:MAG: hypothetical protein QOG85_853 [Gaiellaceae bacterium]|nr:hypothetical protein [Gaiellaceae bacterium]
MSTPRILQINTDGTFDLVCSDSDLRAVGLTVDDFGETPDFAERLAKAHATKTEPTPEEIKAALVSQREEIDAAIAAVDAEIAPAKR